MIKIDQNDELNHNDMDPLPCRTPLQKLRLVKSTCSNILKRLPWWAYRPGLRTQPACTGHQSRSQYRQSPAQQGGRGRMSLLKLFHWLFRPNSSTRYNRDKINNNLTYSTTTCRLIYTGTRRNWRRIQLTYSKVETDKNCFIRIRNTSWTG